MKGPSKRSWSSLEDNYESDLDIARRCAKRRPTPLPPSILDSLIADEDDSNDSPGNLVRKSVSPSHNIVTGADTDTLEHVNHNSRIGCDLPSSEVTADA